MITNWFRNSSSEKIGDSRSQGASLHIGQRVRNGRFGSGRVRALRPDGAVIVRFDGQKSSQIIFPSLLERGG